MRSFLGRIITAGCLCWCMQPAQAQDSLQQVYTQQFASSYCFFMRDALSQGLYPLKQYAVIEAGARLKGGGYALAQDAARQRDIFFRTAGTRTLKKWLLSGVFSYENTTKDSVGYTLRNNLYNPAPYYFFAGKKGNWQVISYHLQGIVSRALLHDKLTAAAGVRYHTSDGWRSNDPRSEYFDWHFAADASLVYRVAPRHQLGISGGIVRKVTDTNLEYRNKDYQYSLSKPEYMNYLQDGYGYVELKTGNTNIASSTGGYTLQALYNGRFAWGDVTLTGGYLHQDSRFYQKGTAAAEASPTYGWFYETAHQAAAHWQYKQGSQQWSATVQYSNREGRDYNTMLSGNNYVYSCERLQIAPLFLQGKAQQPQYELGIQGSLTNLYRADGSAGQTAEYRTATAGVLAAWYCTTNGNNGLLKILVQDDIQQSLSATVSQPAQQPAFTKAVIFRDYYYYGASVNTLHAEALYRFPLQKKQAFVKAAGEYQQATLPAATVPAGSLPGNNRWQFQFSIGLTL